MYELQREIKILESKLEQASLDVKSRDEQIACLRMQIDDISSSAK